MRKRRILYDFPFPVKTVFGFYCNYSKVASHAHRGGIIARSASMQKIFGFIPDMNINIDNLY
jgi:hypothetical protein